MPRPGPSFCHEVARMSASSDSAELARQAHTRMLIAGALIGAALGAVAAHLLWQQAHERDPSATRVPLDARQGLRLALIVLKTLRQIAGLAV